MIDRTTQKQLLESGLSLKEYVLLSFLQQAPEALRLTGVGVKNIWCYELTINQVLNELPILQVKERWLKEMLKNLELKGFIKKFKSKHGFYYQVSGAVECTTEHRVVQKNAQLNSSGAEKCTTETSKNGDIDIYILNKYNTLNNINITNKGGGGSTRSVLNINKYPITTIEEVKGRFKSEFPEKSIYFEGNLPENFDLELFISKIKESPDLLVKHDYIGLKYCLENYKRVVEDYYKMRKKETLPTQIRDYDSEENYG